MKRVATILVAAACIPSTSGAGLRNAPERMAWKKPKPHDYHLMSQKYTFGGSGADLDALWAEPLCSDTSDLVLYVRGGARRYAADGKPGSSTGPLVYGYLDKWSSCSNASAVHTFFDVDVFDDPSIAFRVGPRQRWASLSLQWNVSLQQELCKRSCDTIGGATSCHYENCTIQQSDIVVANLTARLNGTGPVEEYNEFATGSGNGVNYRSTLHAHSRHANAAVVLLLNGTKMSLPGATVTYGAIQKISQGQLDKY